MKGISPISGKEDALWLVHDGQKEWGPYPTEQVIQLLHEGRIDWLWNIWRDGMVKWVPVAQLFTIPELADDGKIKLRKFPVPVR